MGANAGRAENGFPKIRNPYLTGIACKHVLRAMVELDSSLFIWKFIAKTIEEDRKKNADKTRRKLQKTVTLSQKEANELAERQSRKRRSVDSKKYKDSASDRAKIAEGFKKLPKPKKVKRTAKRPGNAMDEFNKIVKEANVLPETAEKIRALLMAEMKKK